jgi:DNA-directed RNA polymerase subunit L
MHTSEQETAATDVSRVIRIPDEDHTLGTALTMALWANPHVTVAQYAQKHPVHREEISVHCQTDATMSATASVEEALMLVKRMLGSVGQEMGSALEAWEALSEEERGRRNQQSKASLEVQLEDAMEKWKNMSVEERRQTSVGELLKQMTK